MVAASPMVESHTASQRTKTSGAQDERADGPLKRLIDGFRSFAWFPQIPMGLAVLALGVFQLGGLVDQLIQGGFSLTNLLNVTSEILSAIASGAQRVVSGVFLTTMAFGLMMRSRMAWVIVFVVLVANILATLIFKTGMGVPSILFQLALLGAMWRFRRDFSESSLAAAGIFSVGSIILLFGYAMIGSLILGQQFSTPITDWTTAFYFSIVTMSTVGYGDISPTTPHSQLFVISLILLGLTVFATSLSTVLVPLVNQRLRSLIHGRPKHVIPTDHFVIVSDSVLAENCRQDLISKGEKVVQILPESTEDEDESGDFIHGNPNDLETLRKANVAAAKAVLALGTNDAANAFVVLAVRELDEKVKTVVAVNETRNLQRVKRVGPDVVIAPTLLGSELLTMALTGQEMDSSTMISTLLHYAD